MEFEELKTLGSLPSPSGVALEVMRLTQRADVSIEDIAKPVQADPALTGQLLKIVNSAV
jgi:two-component system cell cycle response regulator